MDTFAHLDQRRRGRLVIGLMSLAAAVAYLVGALDMPRGQLASPGPGMYPVVVAALWILASIVVAAEALLSPQVGGSIELPTGFERRQALIFIGTLVAFVLALPYLGFSIAASLYVIACLRFLGEMSWPRSVIGGVAMAVGVALLFGQLLALRLPMAG
jgi:putative tricarboxylic transport membrane protein